MRKAMQDAYALDDTDQAKAKLERLADSLDEQHPSATAALRERLDETLTVATIRDRTDAAQVDRDNEPDREHVLDGAAGCCERVSRWQSGTMVLRWAPAGTMEAEATWRRLMGKTDMPDARHPAAPA